MLIEGGSTKVVGAVVGIGSLALGIAEASSGSLFAPLNVAAGSSLLVVLWVGHRIVRIADKFFEEQGAKLIALPTAEELKSDKRTLFEKLEAFAHEASEERKETAVFRRELSGLLADHGARIRSVEETVRHIAGQR